MVRFWGDQPSRGGVRAVVSVGRVSTRDGRGQFMARGGAWREMGMGRWRIDLFDEQVVAKVCRRTSRMRFIDVLSSDSIVTKSPLFSTIQFLLRGEVFSLYFVECFCFEPWLFSDENKEHWIRIGRMCIFLWMRICFARQFLRVGWKCHPSWALRAWPTIYHRACQGVASRWPYRPHASTTLISVHTYG